MAHSVHRRGVLLRTYRAHQHRIIMSPNWGWCYTGMARCTPVVGPEVLPAERYLNPARYFLECMQ